MVVEENESRKSNPVFDFNRGIPLMGPGVKLKMNSTTPIKSGNNDYGEWNMWSANVEGLTVFEGRKPNETKIDDYTGEVIFFAKKNMNEELKSVIGGEEGAVIQVRKEAEETPKGLIKKYFITKVGGSSKPSDDGLTPSEKKLVSDATDLVSSGYELSEDDFVKASKDDALYGKLEEDRVRELYKFVGK